MNSAASKILLIGDDESTRDAITGMLQWQNLVPIHASDPQTGFEQAFTGKPELVILDLHLARDGKCGAVPTIASIPDPIADYRPQPARRRVG